MPASPSRAMPAPGTPPSAVATPRRRRRLLQGKPTSRHRHSPSSSLLQEQLQAPASPLLSFLTSPSPSPSPFHRFLPSPLRASSAVPFSWEHRPGIPKTPARNPKGGRGSKALPLPPSLLARSCAGGGADPYASSVVPAEYAAAAAAMDPNPPPDRAARLGWRVRVRRTRRRSSSRLGLGDALAEWLSMLSLYRSCKRAAACFAAKARSSAA